MVVGESLGDTVVAEPLIENAYRRVWTGQDDPHQHPLLDGAVTSQELQQASLQAA